MANITKIKASDSKKATNKPKKATSAQAKPPKKPVAKTKKTEKPKRFQKLKKFFYIIFTPLRWIFKPLSPVGRYITASWGELRQVRWLDRKATWKMVVAVLVYTGLLIAFIMILDAIFTLLFNLLLS